VEHNADLREASAENPIGRAPRPEPKPEPQHEPKPAIGLLDPEVLGNLTIELVAQLGRGSMTIHQLASLKSGEIVPLDTPLNGTIDLTLSGALVARGEIVAVDDQFGLRITEIFARQQ
jgi:flagellar motor switch protein FliN/FliY